ncbi:unnamed protein product [Owenia fusiformis]|uniref:Uncharacterized protein n=1 Tax=Owenia fusiformis TaxID=6347 RepID=A0A8S4NNM5_OWEFU|nr:unnamed protein product [Owenia fusiformis]
MLRKMTKQSLKIHYLNYYASLVFLLSVIQSCKGANYPACTNKTQQYDGYPYILDENEGRMWGYCGFPDVSNDDARCGRRTRIDFERETIEYFVCDPDFILGPEEATSIDNDIIIFRGGTPGQCRFRTIKQNFTIAIALTQQMRMPDLQADGTCINDCGEIYPLLDYDLRNLTSPEDQQTIANLFAESLRSRWKAGACGNDIVIFYNREYGVVASAVGYALESTLTADVIAAIHLGAMDLLHNGNVSEGLENIVNGYYNKLRGLTPAYILLMMSAAFWTLFALFMLFFLQLGNNVEGTWSDGYALSYVGTVIYYVSFAWIFKALFNLMAFVEHFAQWWHVVFGTLVALGLIGSGVVWMML